MILKFPKARRPAMKIKIVHLYSDLLNLYGEYGNVLALNKRLIENGCETEIISHKFGEKIILDGVSFLYCGAGTEKKLLVALSDIMNYREEITSYIQKGGIGLFSGNASELLGKSIKDLDLKEYAALGVFDYTTEIIDARFTGDVICETSLFPQTVIGFINKSSNTSEISNAFLTVKNQFCNLYIPETDGGICGSFISTHLLGPVLIKNPPLLEFFARAVCDRHGIVCNDSENENILKAYQMTLSEQLGARNF